MPPRAQKKQHAGIQLVSIELERNLPTLFMYIGWARHYQGGEQLEGRHGYLRANPGVQHGTEAQAFLAASQGRYESGIGKGKAPAPLHVVFVALDPSDQIIRVVGVYASASVQEDGDWQRARTRWAALIPVGLRPELGAGWTGQGVRRWARRKQGTAHPNLLKAFERLKATLPDLVAGQGVSGGVGDQTYPPLHASEGEIQRKLILHRRREWRLREAKLAQAKESQGGKLICEVRGCGFDFEEKYGPLGKGYAHVHHLTPLSQAGENGTEQGLDDLAIVCANCHAMIHTGGMCRQLDEILL